MSLINAPLMLGGNIGYQISRSVRLRASAGGYFSRTPGSTTNRQIMTWSGWVKRGSLSDSGYMYLFGAYPGTSATDTINFINGTLRVWFNGSTSADLVTTQVFRDPSSWYHLVVAIDTTQATASNRIKVYVNGSQVTAFSTASYPVQNYNTFWNSSSYSNQIGANGNGPQSYFDGYLTEINFIDGQALTPSSFGETNTTTGVWQPKRYTGTYGTNGFYLNFSDNSTVTTALSGNNGIGKDFSGNGNYWVSNNISLYGGTVQSYTAVGTTSWTAPAGVTQVQYLIVGGGGGGGAGLGGGGGAGGFLTGTLAVTPGASYTVTVGGGGAGGASAFENGSKGSNSVFGSLTAFGGGGGCGYNDPSWSASGVGAGGSGGGSNTSTGTGGNGTAGQGNAGGLGHIGSGGLNSGNGFNTGGGGGAGAAGGNANGSAPGNGGAGLASSITGASVFYAGGGAGGPDSARVGSSASGGSGGGGNSNYNSAGSNGAANTGGGGGGGSNRAGGGNGFPGGAGGSGIVVIAYGSSATYDSMLDVPTAWADGGNGRGNYCVLNPIMPGVATGGGAVAGVRDGNLLGGNPGSGGWGIVGSTMAIPSGGGKFYFECTVGASGQSMSVGVQKTGTPFAALYIVGNTGDANGYSYCNDGLKYNNGGTAYASTAAAGDVIGVAVDASGGTSSITFYKNGTSLGVAFTGITGDLLPAMSSVSGSGMCPTNFGQRPFAYTPPSGFKALNTLNLPTPTIPKGASYFDVLTWSGTGGAAGATRSITGLGFQPDFVWEKNRASTQDHHLYDSSRGAGLSKTLASNSTGAEGGFNDTLYGYLSSFDANGITTTNGSSTWDNWNKSGDTYVAWNWKETPTAGFDIVTYTGNGSSSQTIAHNLGVAPRMMIVKQRNGTEWWQVYHASLGATATIWLNSTSNAGGGLAQWNNTSPSASVFTLGSGNQTNGASLTYVAYLFAAVPGFSAFGSYTGNGSSDGPFVFTGMRPRWILVKCSSNSTTSTVWSLHDTSRDPYNAAVRELDANSAALEAVDSSGMDILSNGFKPRRNSEYLNLSGWTYIYAAFAENPFKYALAR